MVWVFDASSRAIDCEVTVSWRSGPREPKQGAPGQPRGMLGALRDLILYRLIGGRLMLGLALLGLARRILGARRRRTGASVYQPSQGSSQMVQREPR